MDDLLLGIKSTALKFGEKTKFYLSGFGATMISNLLVCGYLTDQTAPYYLAVALAGSHLFHQLRTLKINDPGNCAELFISNSNVGLLLFLGIVLGNLLRQKEKPKKETSIDAVL